MRKLVTLAVMGLVMSAQVFGLAAFPAGAADHLDGPLAASDGRLDINDIYVFHPGDAGSQDLSKTVFVMTVNPGAGVISGENFANNATYEFKLDYDGDAVEDARILTRFTGVRKDGSQRYETRFIQNGNIPPRGKIAIGRQVWSTRVKVEREFMQVSSMIRSSLTSTASTPVRCLPAMTSLPA